MFIQVNSVYDLDKRLETSLNYSVEAVQPD